MVNKNLENILQMHKLWLEGDDKGKRANLHYANLRSANLRHADLHYAYLRNADLCGADLYGADLRNADLRNANLFGADLRNANLYGADLRNTDLRNANLRNADLRNAILRSANLTGANLHGADLYGADLSGANTNSVKGVKIYSIDNVGTYNGKITYVPSLNMVYAGCWNGTVKEFLVKCKEVIKENDKDLNLDIALSMIQQLHDKYKKMNRGQSK